MSVVPEQDPESSVTAKLCSDFLDAMSVAPEQDFESSITAKLCPVFSDAMSVVPEQDPESSVTAKSCSVFLDAMSHGSCGDLAAPTIVEFEGRCIRLLFRCMEVFDLEGTHEICECMTKVGLSLRPGVQQCVLGWVQSACSLVKLLSDPSFDDFMNEIAVHRCCFQGQVEHHCLGRMLSLPFEARPDCDDSFRIRACQRICCLAPGVFDSKCQQAIGERWHKDDFLDWWRMKIFDPFDDIVGVEFVDSFMLKLWHEDSEGFLQEWPYWNEHHKAT
jgi:hypothetical protein